MRADIISHCSVLLVYIYNIQAGISNKNEKVGLSLRILIIIYPIQIAAHIDNDNYNF